MKKLIVVISILCLLLVIPRNSLAQDRGTTAYDTTVVDYDFSAAFQNFLVANLRVVDIKQLLMFADSLGYRTTVYPEETGRTMDDVWVTEKINDWKTKHPTGVYQFSGKLYDNNSVPRTLYVVGIVPN